MKSVSEHVKKEKERRKAASMATATMLTPPQVQHREKEKERKAAMSMAIRQSIILDEEKKAVTKVKAKHIANQAGLNRLQEYLVTTALNPNSIRRALQSLQECKEPILTYQDAVMLKYIGPSLAKAICPQSTGCVVNVNVNVMTEEEAEEKEMAEKVRMKMKSVSEHVKKEQERKAMATMLTPSQLQHQSSKQKVQHKPKLSPSPKKREKPPLKQQAGYRYDLEEYGGWGFGGKYNNPGRYNSGISFNERQRFYNNNLERYGIPPRKRASFSGYYYDDDYVNSNVDYYTKDYLFYRPDGDTEGKAIDWFESNGFFQVAHEPEIIWSGPWYYRHHPEEKKENYDCSHITCPVCHQLFVIEKSLEKHLRMFNGKAHNIYREEHNIIGGKTKEEIEEDQQVEEETRRREEAAMIMRAFHIRCREAGL